MYYSHFIYRCAKIKKKIIPAPKGYGRHPVVLLNYACSVEDRAGLF